MIYFEKDELNLIYQYAHASKDKTLSDLKEIVLIVKGEVRSIVKNTIVKLESIPDPDCTRFIMDVKQYFISQRDISIQKRQKSARGG